MSKMESFINERLYGKLSNIGKDIINTETGEVVNI